MTILDFLLRKLPKNKRQIILFVLIFILLNFISAILALLPIFRQAGWPVNHEGTAFALRAIYYADAIKSGDIMPIWSPEENYGLGSPMQLFYPRLFNIIASMILLVTGSVKFSICMAIILFSVVGAYGIYLLCREMSLNCWQALVFSLVFSHLNYSQMDFLVRGAMAEYSAMCLLPFLIWWCLRLLRRKEFNWVIVWLSILCGMAHAGIFMAALFMLLLAWIIAFVVYRSKRKEFLLRACIATIIIAIPTIPYVFLIISFKQYFNFSMYNIYLPWNWYQPLINYFIDDAASRNFLGGFSPKLDLIFFTGTLLVFVLSLIVNRTKMRYLLSLQDHPLACCSIFIYLILTFYLWLQSPLSEWFYRYCPGMISLQFPFRLLSFISILLIAAYVCNLQFLHDLIHRKIVWVLVVIPCVFTLIVSLCQPPIARGWIDQKQLEHPAPGNWQEYTPIAPPPIRAFAVWMEHIAKLPVIVNSGKPDNLVVKRGKTGQYMTVYSSSATALEITLPAVWSKYYLILIERNGNTYKLPSFRRGFDPRICIQIPSGENMIIVKYPSVSTIVEQFFYMWIPTQKN